MQEAKPPQMAELLEENKTLLYYVDEMKDRVKRLEAYIFSPKIRAVLFKLSEQEERERIVAKINNENEVIYSKHKSVQQNLQVFLGKVKSVNFYQKWHKKMSLKHLNSAFYENKELGKLLEDLTILFKELKEFPGDRKLVKITKRMRRIFNELSEIIEKIHIYIFDFQGRQRIEDYLSMGYEDLMERNLFDLKDPNKIYKLKSGDLILSFKTLPFMKEKNIPRWIFRITRSQITHVGIFLYDSEGDFMELHHVGMMRFGIWKFSPEEGEMYIVLRPRLSSLQRVKLWGVASEFRREKQNYSKLKVFGVVPSLLWNKLVNLFSKKYVSTGNLFRSFSTGMFCSEVVNELYKRVGFMLTPKSMDSAMVFPSDIVASPNVDFVGLVFDPGEKTKEEIIKELMKGVKI